MHVRTWQSALMTNLARQSLSRAALTTTGRASRGRQRHSHATLYTAFVILRATPAAAPLQLYYSCSVQIHRSTAALGCTSHMIWPAVDLDVHAQAGRVDRCGGVPLRAGRPSVGLEGGARSCCRFAPPPVLFARYLPDSLTYSVPLFLNRQCDRTLLAGGAGHRRRLAVRRPRGDVLHGRAAPDGPEPGSRA